MKPTAESIESVQNVLEMYSRFADSQGEEGAALSTVSQGSTADSVAR